MFLLASIMILNWTVQICSNLCSAWASTWTIRTPGIWPQTTLSAGDQSRSHWYNYRDKTTTTWPPPLIICTVCWPPFTQMHTSWYLYSGWSLVLACLPAWFRSTDETSFDWGYDFRRYHFCRIGLYKILCYRFVHCLRRYRDTRHAFPHLTNAGTSHFSSWC